MTNTNKTTDIHQTLMDRAYKNWEKDPGMKKEAFLALLTPSEHFAVVLGNFNYQVQNGGFMQWHDNGYATPDTVAALKRYLTQIGTDNAKKALELVTTFEKAVRKYERSKEEDRRRSWERDGRDEGNFEEYREALEPLDTAYYVVDEPLMVEVEAFLAKTFVV